MDRAATWAADEFGGVDLGDVRRNARLVQLATMLGAQPSASLPAATDDSAALKAAYRFFANKYVRADAMLASHIQSTTRRLQAVALVLAVQDTTYLDWTDHPATKGLGPLAAATHQGLLAHTTLAITPEHVPLGLLQQQVWARDAASFAQLVDHKQRPIAEKESQKWLTSLDAVIAARATCPDTHFVSVGDREADIYDLFLVARPPGVDLLIRAAQDRKADHVEQYLWAAMATAPVAATVTVHMGARAGQPARNATLTVRWRQVTLRPPKGRTKEQLPQVTVWAVWAIESDPPPGVAPVEWLLLTSMPIPTTDAALERLEWYACRWGIEVWHKVLKSGCRIEDRQLETADRLTRCLTLYSVIAWRIVYATMLARAVPDVPCTVLLDDAEWQGLYCRIQRVANPPPCPPTLRQAVRWIAQLGGFQGRKHDGEPGVTVLWKGFQHLVDVAAMYQIMRPAPTPHSRASQNKDSG
jgi:Transposase DNA-binding/Transposase Tn5 dimerisation domain